MDFSSFYADILATLVGGIILAILFFFSREVLFPIPNITGKWYLKMETENTAYNPYRGMVLIYVIIIWREGNSLRGSAEKIYENSTTGERSYEGKNRTRAVIDGYIEKNYFSKDKVYLHSVEKGHGRESTNFYELMVEKDKKLKGKFNSMVASQDGLAQCQRESF